VSATDHLLHLFDDEASRAETVSAFMREGLAVGDRVLVVATPEHWDAIAARLDERDLDAAVRDGRLTLRDAAATLRTLMHRGVPDPKRFDAAVGALVRQLASAGTPLRVYGEMVDVLAVQGDFDAARDLEALWNQLGGRTPFVLLCGYAAVSFGDPQSAHALRAICSAHSHVISSADDVLGSFLLGRYDARPV
jgi:hypothetical protein